MQAAAKGDERAQYNLGVMYSYGQGVLQDYVRAHMWFNISAVKGDKDAINNRDIAASKMDAQQIAQAQKLARDCLERNLKICD
jgi:TPR repeat protein